MLEARNCYGYGGSCMTSKADLAKYEICYRTTDGGFGIVGRLYSDKTEAEAKANEFKNSRSYVARVWVRHPSKVYSNY